MSLPAPPAIDLPHLPVVIEELYRVFARYRPQARIDSCPCCLSEAQEQALHGPLRALSAEALQPLVRMEHPTGASVEQLAYFVPRMLELMARDELDAEDVAMRLGKARWHTWPADERVVLERVVTAWWRELLADFPGGYPVVGAVRALALLNEDISRFLGYWQDNLGVSAACHLAELVNEHVAWAGTGAPAWEFARLQAWLRQPSLLSGLLQASLASDHPEIAEQLAEAHEWLAAFQRHPPAT